MATMLQAVREYGPKVKRNPTIGLEEASEWMSMRTGLNRSEVMMVLQEMSELIVYFNSQGTPVKLPGVGIFSVSIRRDGEMRINVRSDRALRNGLNAPGAYKGEIINRDRIGLDDEGYKALWDQAHPDDPLEI